MSSRGTPIRRTFPAALPPFAGAREAAEAIEAEVFGSSFGESVENLRRYYDGHLDQTAFVLVGAERWSGMMRIGLPGPRPSLSVEDAAAPPFGVDLDAELAADQAGPAVTLDVLTAAVLRSHRSQGIFGLMLAALVGLAAEHACTHVVAMADRRLVEGLQAGGLPGTVHSGLHPYYGSAATAVTSVRTGALRTWLAGLAAA